MEKMVEVKHTRGSRVKIGDRRGVVHRLLREGPVEKPTVIALVYWDGGAMSFEREKALEPVYV